MRDQRGPDRVGNFPGAGLGALAIAVHGLVATGGGEFVGGLAQDDVDARIGRPTKAASSSGAELTPPQCEGGNRLISTVCSAMHVAGGFDLNA